MNWTERYRPKILEEIIGQHKFVEDAFNWIDKGDMPNLLIYGKPGIGKTTVAHVLANHFLEDEKDLAFIEINASQDRRLEVIRETVTRFTTHKNMSGSKFKIILLDELDGMTNAAQQALKRTMERATDTRFIITCNDPYGVDHAIRSRCANYFFTPIAPEIQMGRLKEIVLDNDVEFSEENISKLLEITNGDMRRAINELQACIFSGKSPTTLHQEHMGPYQKCIEQLLGKNGDAALEFLMRLVYNGHTVKEMCGKLLQCVLDMDSIGATAKFKVVAAIGETEWRARSVAPKVIVGWFVAQFMK